MSSDVGIVFPRTDKYLHSLLRPRDSVLTDLEKDAEKNNVPIVGPLVGNLLSIIAESCNARKVLEIGTATGYSGIWLGRVVKKNSGKLITIEMDPKRREIATRSFRRAELTENIELLSGDANEIVPRLARDERGEFDLVFLDVGDKKLYVDLFEPSAALLRKGGYLVADNVLWSGQVAVPSDKSSETVIIRKFNNLVYSDSRFQPAIIPLRDGVMLARKITDKNSR
ncbi:MAG TPA: O-methyltransferase [Nitrososphaerales archaeon]|nr:O-methyltransferase [Nitrososphaerales archaeon]